MDYRDLDGTIVLAPAHRKSGLLKLRSEHPELNFKIVDKRTLMQQLYFRYDDRAHLYLMRKGIRLENTGEILEAMYFASPGISAKTDELCTWREELLRLGFLQKDEPYEAYYQKQEFLVIGYPETDLELKKIAASYRLHFRFQAEEAPLFPEVAIFENAEDEMRYLFESVFRLYQRGVPFNRIKVVADQAMYHSLLRKYQNFYSIRFHLPGESTYFLTDEYRRFRDMLKNTLVSEAFGFAYDCAEYPEYLEKMFSRYLKVEKELRGEEILPYFDSLASEIRIDEQRYDQGIDVISLEEADPEDFVFLLGFAQDVYPKVRKDDEYLSDREKERLGLPTSLQRQEEEEAEILAAIGRLRHLSLSYCKTHGKEVFYLSPLVEKYGMRRLEQYEFEPHFYSVAHFEFWIGKQLDDIVNFSCYSPYVASVSEEEIGYRAYRHAFQGVSSYRCKEPLALSFTSLETFFLCPFHYYLSYVLRADEFEDTIFSKTGTLIHRIFEDETDQVRRPLGDYLKEAELNPEETVVLEALLPQVETALEHFASFREHTSLTEFTAEKSNLVYAIDDTARLIGKIDLVLSNQTSFAIVDYKTKEFRFEPKKVPFGLSMQLPLYYLLATAPDSEYRFRRLEGLYIHTVISKEYYSGERDYLQFRGITLHEDSFDTVQGSGAFIRPSRKKYIPYDEAEFSSLIEQTKTNLQTAVSRIREGSFDIQPKVISHQNASCPNCPFADVCYHDYKDNIYLSIKEQEE